VTEEIVFELSKFHNIDLFQRGFYQLRISLKQPPKQPSVVECTIWENTSGNKPSPGVFQAFLTDRDRTAVSKTFEVYYKHEEVIISDVFVFKFHMLLDSSKVEEQFPKTIDFDIDLFFSDCNRSPSTPRSLRPVSNQVLRVYASPIKSLHYHRNVVFDYFNLAAVSFTVHACLVAIRQPWLGSLKILHPPLGNKSTSKHYLYCALFGKSNQLTSDTEVTSKQHGLAAKTHRNLCLSLLKAYSNLLRYFHFGMSFLPDYAQMRVSQPDINSKLDVLSNEYDNMWVAEELYSRMGDDLYLLSTELSMLWTQFLEQFIREGFLVKHLKDEHHRQRVEHLAEAFFVEDHDWEEFCTPFDLTTSQYTSLANLVRGSSYYQMLTPLKVECVSIDGDPTTMPIIFEDRFLAGENFMTADGVQRLSIEENLFEDFIDLDVSVAEDRKQVTATAVVDEVKLAWSDRAQASEPLRNRGNSSEAVFCVVGKSEDSSPEMKGRNTVVRRSASRNSELGATGSDRRGFDVNEAASNPLGKPKYSSAPDMHHVESNSPVELRGAGLLSCFPSFKTGSNKSKQYQLVVRSPNGSASSGTSFERKISRFEKAKQNLRTELNLPAQLYSDVFDPTSTKPYFTERLLSNVDNCHLVICVHGLDGNSGDLRLIRCYLELALPRSNFDFLMSEVNQDDTFRDIDQLTENLVLEIVQHMEMNHLDPIKISFVGHSLGNIIIRNAAVHSKLLPYRNRFHTFLSLSGPHLGMLYHTSSLVSTGLWLMQKWKKTGALPQLALNDNSDLRETFMYRLSLTNGFQYFKNVLLVSSVQDHYVPFHSSRIEMSKQALKDNSETGRVYREMINNILKPLQIQNEVNVVRYSVNHVISSSANSLIGRAAHIAMLDSELFIEKLILISACQYFR